MRMLALLVCAAMLAACGPGQDPGLKTTPEAEANTEQPGDGPAAKESDKEPEKEPEHRPETEPDNTPQSETLPDLPGEEVQVGKVYDGPATLKVSMYGVSFKLPAGFRTGIAPGSPAFEIQSTQRPGLGVIVMKQRATAAEIRAEMAQPQDMGGGVVLQPLGAVEESGGTLSVWYGDAVHIARCVARLGERGNGVAFLFGAERAQREWVDQTLKALVDGVTLGAPRESQDERQWRQLLAGQKLTFMRSSYDRDYGGGGTGSSTREEISLGADGSFYYFYRSTFTVTSPGGTALGNDPVEDRGTWEVESVGAAVHLVLKGGRTRRYALSLSNNRVFLDGRQFFRTLLE